MLARPRFGFAEPLDLTLPFRSSFAPTRLELLRSFTVHTTTWRRLRLMTRVVSLQLTETLTGSAGGPLRPSGPAAPAGPAGPCPPSGPRWPNPPGSPSTPFAPCEPVAPVAPVGPAGPVSPVGPCAPVVPVDPCAPV